jgi:Tfp pilus tip-associated adhesin PilY1
VSVRVEPTVNPVNLPSQRGWYIDFSLASGERVVTNPQIENGGGVVVATYQPNSNPCTSGGNSWLMVVNYATGGSFPQPMLDVNGDGSVNSTDQTATGQNPVGLALNGVYASEPTIVQKNGPGSAPGAKETQLSNGSVLAVGEAGGVTQRNSWWEIR